MGRHQARIIAEDRPTCGEYPVETYDAALYRCPSFTASPDTAAPADRVIPLVRAAAPFPRTLRWICGTVDNLQLQDS